MKTKSTHTVKHHSGARHSFESKRSMEVFALLREEVRHLRRVNSDLLEAAKQAKFAMGIHGPCDNHSCDRCEQAWKSLRIAIAKATNQEVK